MAIQQACLLDHHNDSMPPVLTQQVVGTLSHHINSALMTALLEFDTIQQYIVCKERPTPQVETALTRLAYALERIQRVIKSAQGLSDTPANSDIQFTQLLEVELARLLMEDVHDPNSCSG